MSTNLFSDFDPASKNDWLERVAKELKGRPMEELHWAIDQGIEMPPFVHREDASTAGQSAIGARRRNNDWHIGEQFEAVEGEKAVNTLLITALQKGVEAPLIRFASALSDWDWSVALHGVMPQMIFLNLDLRDMPKEAASNVLEGFVQWLATLQVDKASLKGAIATSSTEVSTLAFQQLPAFDLYAVVESSLSEEAQGPVAAMVELLEAAMSLLDEWTVQGVDLAAHSSKLYFKIGIGTSYFVEIAKIRAFHLLWANVLSAYGLTPTHATVEAHLSDASQTEEKHDNMIRATTQALSAAIGGISRLYIAPANASFETPTAFTRRVARNLQHVLKMESFLDRVVDPAAGSYYIEQMTQKLARAVWERLGESR
ncbi:MAG: methylmalonyl-CoA mutase family protein [Bacteroidota bacterium]